MKATKNILYVTENYLRGKLVEDNTITEKEVKQLELTDKQSEDLRAILLSHITNNGHRCISVYRDGFIIGSDTYNICLSCGDFYKNDQRFYLSGEGVDKFKELKSTL